MKIRRILIACFAFFVAKNISAQVLTDTLTVEGKPVRMQKMTLKCGFWWPEDSRWKHLERTYTLHIIDKKALSDKKKGELRSDALGYYAWSDNSWDKFDDIDENAFWLISDNDVDFGTQDVCSIKRGCRGRATYKIKLRNIRRGIDRATLSMVVETGDFYAINTGPGRKDDYEDPAWPGDVPSDRSRCEVLQYRKPPERIGF